MSVRARGTLGRLLLTLLIALLALGMPLAPANADPTVGPAVNEPLPVAVNLTKITPTFADSSTPVHVEAELTNNGDETITELWIRLQRDQWISTRAQMQIVDDQQPPYAWAMSAPTSLSEPLEPGGSMSVALTVSRDELVMYDAGAYPILLNVYGTVDGWENHLGQAAFTMPHADQRPDTPLGVSWVLPLIDQPRRVSGTDVFTDDTLATEISTGGRLATILDAAEEYGEQAKISLVVDPALIDALDAMSNGYQVRTDTGNIDGAGAEAAASFLSRLTDVADTSQIIATPYSDVDSVALVRAGLPEVLSDARTYGSDIITDVLDTDPITNIAWPADGIMTDDTWQTLIANGVDTALLSGASYGQEDYLESPLGITESASTVLPNGRAIVADPGLSRLLTAAPQYAGGPVPAAQRITAELAMISLQMPTEARNVVLAPPRDWAPSEQLLDDLFAATTNANWLTPMSLQQVSEGTAVDRGPLQYPASLSQQELPGNILESFAVPVQQVAELGSAFNPEDTDEALWPTRAALFDAASSAWRGGDGSAVSNGLDTANDALATLRAQIHIVTPSDGTYTLTSSDAPLVFTIENNLPWDVHYRIGIDESRSVGLTADDVGVQTIPGGTRATVQLPTTVERSGAFTVVAQIRTPDGDPLGNDVQINVSSSAYGTAALWVTGIAFTALLALIARRWWRRHLFWAEERRKRAAAQAHQLREDAGDHGQHEYRSDDAIVPPDFAGYDVPPREEPR
ncbi:MAG: DUF6049 family protein [Cumulibacter sp.]